MRRKKRNPVKVRPSGLRYKISKWCKLHYKDGTLFNIPMLCNELGLNPDSRNDYNKVYGVLVSWRKGFIDLYRKWKGQGLLKGKNSYEAWETMLDNYNKNDAYVFLSEYDKETQAHYFIQPSFRHIEKMDRIRLEKQWKGIETVIEEMQTINAQFVLSSGEHVPIDELLTAGKQVSDLLVERKDKEKD